MANPAYINHKSTETREIGGLGVLLKDTPNLKKIMGGVGGGGLAIPIAGGYPPNCATQGFNYWTPYGSSTRKQHNFDQSQESKFDPF